MIKLLTNVLGVFAVKNKKVVERILFKGSSIEIASKLDEAAKGACKEELELVDKLIKTGSKKIIVNKPSRFWGLGLDVEFLEDTDKPVDVFQISNELGLDGRKTRTLLTDVNIALTQSRLKVIEPSQTVMQAVSALDDLEDVSNRLSERLREWYGIHFPELTHLVESNDMYSQVVADFGLRADIKVDELKVEPAFRDRIIETAKSSVGGEFTEADVEPVKSIAKSLAALTESRIKIEEYIGVVMQEIAPNLSALAGPLLGARLIKMSNGLPRMATLPSSTIQIIGAEDAFFRFLKTGKRPPKHGIIFQHPDLRSTPKKIRGKLARTLASKLATAAKIDAYKGEYMGDKLKADFQKRVDSLRK